jgi:tetratricopeptide (TPR) repeat protein
MAKRNPLKPVSLIGIAFIIIIAIALLAFSISRNELIFPGQLGTNFTRDLGRYDEAMGVERPELLARRLDRLERRAKSQDEWLSLLKRRRNLARLDTQYISAYQKSGNEAVKAFPYSEMIIAVAGESLLYDAMANSDLLYEYAGRLSRQRYDPLVLSFYALTGVLGDPEKTAEIDGIEILLSAELAPELRNLFRVNTVLLNILKGEILAAQIGINGLLETYPSSRELLLLGGEFFYDYGNLLRSSELFSKLGEVYLGRAADALALAGEIPAARSIWTALGNSRESDSSKIIAQSLYNLASTSSNEREAAAWLERIFTSGAISETEKLYAMILYTRLQNTSRAIAMLEEENLKANPLLDLELLRRRLDTWPLDRSTAEAWLLLGRHPESEALYQWAAWFFDRQKIYAETAQLLKISNQRQISAPWLELTLALTLLREGNINEGLNLLQAELQKNSSRDWRIPANIARVMESRRSITAALDLYQRAALLAETNQDMALIQLRISRCLEALGYNDESRRALEYAQELDPENFFVRMELWRLTMP